MAELTEDIEATLIHATTGEPLGSLTLPAGTVYQREGNPVLGGDLRSATILAPNGPILVRYRILVCCFRNHEGQLCLRPANGRFCAQHR